MKTFRLGFTGTQQGMNSRQLATLRHHLERLAVKHEIFEAHHGDCIGADEDFHNLVLDVLQDRVTVVLHPPVVARKRAFCTAPKQIERPPFDYLVRNHHIVDGVDGMFAAPKGLDEELRSGTWATVRYCRKVEKPLIMLWPSKVK